MVARTLALFTAKRVPLIRFRKGGYGHPSATAANQGAVGSTTTAIEDWELPPRYWRKPIDPIEIEYINRGGPAA